jgi:exopolysaccharide biosynthesis polyprenyl glycosylphosphotransferase
VEAAPLLVRNSRETLRLSLYVGLVVLDLLSIAASFMLANGIRFGNPLHGQGFDMLAVLLPLYLVVAMYAGAYSLEVLQQPRLGMSKSLQAFLVATAAVLGVAFYLKAGGDFSRLTFGIGSLVSLAALAGCRWLYGQAAGRACHWRFTNEVLFVDGVPAHPQGGEIVVFAEQFQLGTSADDPLLLDRMGRLLQNCDRVILACPPERRLLWASMFKGAHIDVELYAPELDRLGALRMRRSGERSTLVVGVGPLGIRDRLLKRAFDLAISISALILLLPLMLLVAALIKLESPGPVLFQQERIGRGNRIFSLLKFRSMRSADLNGDQSATPDDARITRIGRFIRRTSIDELPQLINVIAGTMSIVGPRPHALGSTAEEMLFWKVDPRYWERHSIKPGLTGLAQIRGYRGATRTASDLTNRLQADLEYLSDWSLGLDLAIVFRTARVLIHRNAY